MEEVSAHPSSGGLMPESTRRYAYYFPGRGSPHEFEGPLSLDHAWLQAENEYGVGGRLAPIVDRPRCNKVQVTQHLPLEIRIPHGLEGK